MAAPGSLGDTPPRVVALLATRNGMRWLPEQLASILAQQGVDLSIVASDDASTDGTRAWLEDAAAREPRLRLLPDTGASGSSAANFALLLRTAVIPAGSLVAFADQDDLWHPGKLARHAELLRSLGVDGVSSSITAFDESGRRTLVRKDYPQRQWDFLLESPGPGCTFLLSSRLAALVVGVLERHPGLTAQVDFHDSLIYAIARAHGWRWHIDGVPSVDYRQHDSNVLGSNTGMRAARTRLALIRSHWLRDHAIALTEVSIAVARDAAEAREHASADAGERAQELARIRLLMAGRGIRDRLQMARMAGTLRRRPRDRRIMRGLIALGVW